MRSLLVMLAVSLVLEGCGADPEASGRTVLARVGDWELTRAEMVAELEKSRRSGADLTRELVERRVDRAMFAEAARRAGYFDDAEAQAANERQAIARYLDATLETRLDAITVDHAEVEARYAADIGRYTEPAAVRLAGILIPVPEDADAEARAAKRAKAEEALAAIVEQEARPDPPETFGGLAVRFSEDRTTRYSGGDLGWLDSESDRGGFGPALVAAAADLGRIGALSGVLETPAGFAIVKLLGARTATTRPLEEVGNVIRSGLLHEQRAAARDAFRAELRAEVGVEIDEVGLATALPGEHAAAPETESRERPAPQPPALPGG